MVSFCTRVECQDAIPFCSLMKARVLLDAYFTISPSKVAIITQAPAPLNLIWEDRNADPIWITALKVTSYILLAPLVLVAFLAKCALYCVPLHTYAPRISSTITALPAKESVAEQLSISKDIEPEAQDETYDQIAKYVEDKRIPPLDVVKMMDLLFTRSFPLSCPKIDYPSGSLLSNQQIAHLKNYTQIKARFLEKHIPKDQRRTTSHADFVFVRKTAINTFITQLAKDPEGVQGYATLRIFYQTVLDCYDPIFKAYELQKTEYASLTQGAVQTLLRDMAKTQWSPHFCTFLKICEPSLNTQAAHILQTRAIVLSVFAVHSAGGDYCCSDKNCSVNVQYWRNYNNANEYVQMFLKELPNILTNDSYSRVDFGKKL